MFENFSGLDSMFSDDPKKQAQWAMIMGLLGNQGGRGGRGFMQGLGQAGLLGMNQFERGTQGQQRARSQKQEADLRDMQMAQMKRQNEDQAYGAQIAPQFFSPGNAPADGMGPSMPPKQDFSGYGAALAQRNPAMGLPYIQAGMKDTTPISVKPGESLVDRNTFQPKFTAPIAPDKPPELVRYQQIADDPTQSPQVRATARAYVQKATSHAPAANVTTNVMPPREVFKDSLGLKKDFDAQPEVKGFKEVQAAWDQIDTALKNPSAANDLAAATKFMKLLDPGSVVRESELMMAMQASGVLDRFANYHNLLLKGQKLTPTQREDFYKSGQALYEASKDRFGQTVQQYEGIADQYGLDKRFIEKSKPRAIPSGPKPGTVDGDYYFKGGNPADPKNWVKRK